jgi:fatty acid desaturase
MNCKNRLTNENCDLENTAYKNTAAGGHNESEIIMWGLIKIFWALYKSGRGILNPNYNPMRHAPAEVKFLATVILACFWCLAFGIFAGELLTIGYNMIGHIAVLAMVFVTWSSFQWFRKKYPALPTPPLMRDPGRAQRDYELTDQEREQAAQRTNGA